VHRFAARKKQNMLSAALLLLALTAVVSACNRTTPIKTTATANKTLSLSSIGTLSTKLEIREAGENALAVAWFTWSGTDAATVASTVTLFRFDTNKLAELQTQEAAFDLDPDSSKSISTDTTTETRRRCAAITITITGFNSSGEEKTTTGNAQACEKS
jgi:hypothetical protein